MLTHHVSRSFAHTKFLRAASLTSESADSAVNSPETEDYELASYEGEEKAPLDADFFDDEDEDKGEDEQEAPDDEDEDEGEDEKEAPIIMFPHSTTTTTPPTTTEEAPDDEDEDEGEDEKEAPAEVGSSNLGGECYNVFSEMTFNALRQGFAGKNPDKHATGYTNCKLCTDNRLKCHNTQVKDVFTMLIGSHIHVCQDQGNDGKDCIGPPVINFCGDHNWVIKPSPGYSKKCTMVDEDTHTANIGDMTGKHVDDDPDKMSLEKRVRDIGMNPHKYYFNFHSDASWAHWSNTENPKPMGMCRGRVEMFSERSTAIETERELENGQQ
jgi:hypothetical protein